MKNASNYNIKQLTEKEQEILQALNDLKYYEAHSKFPSTKSMGRKLAYRIAIPWYSKLSYQERKVRLEKKLIDIIRLKGEHRVP